MKYTLEKSFMVTPRRTPGPGTGLPWGLGTASLQGSQCGRAGKAPGAAGWRLWPGGQRARGARGGSSREEGPEVSQLSVDTGLGSRRRLKTTSGQSEGPTEAEGSA
ncbi:unnamed protein product, partial [Gulo gulo]